MTDKTQRIDDAMSVAEICDQLTAENEQLKARLAGIVEECARVVESAIRRNNGVKTGARLNFILSKIRALAPQSERQLAELRAENKKLRADIDAEEGEHAEHIAQAKFELTNLMALLKRVLPILCGRIDIHACSPQERQVVLDVRAAIDAALREGEK